MNEQTRAHSKALTLIYAILGLQTLCVAATLWYSLGWMQDESARYLRQHYLSANRAAIQNPGELEQRARSLVALHNAALRPIAVHGLSLMLLVTACGALGIMFMVRYCERKVRHLNGQLEDFSQLHQEELLKTRDAVIMGLAKFAEFRDLTTSQHLERIGSYVELLATCLRQEEPEKYPMFSDDFIRDLCAAAGLHDIGKVGVPDYILFKAGQLTPEERSLIEDHPIIGGECLSSMEEQLGRSRFLSLAREIAYSHHEWWNGRGYPYKLEAEAIPLSARVVAVADVYDALTSCRPYKRSMSHQEAREIILSGMGTQFDPFVVGAFLLRESQFKLVAQETRREAIVERMDKSQSPEPDNIPDAAELSEILG